MPVSAKIMLLIFQYASDWQFQLNQNFYGTSQHNNFVIKADPMFIYESQHKNQQISANIKRLKKTIKKGL